ncbi:MAG TPA: hypothetical protein VGR32_03930 [Brevundimonas sp.]|jgi:hypothetical protein|uniref:hypothetical protein n=1 Tax=Brevundimonas sp. TaxID=1871086 RepID=UPI002DE44B46|nr:hypothetical protein [Brevundimonas sp.]
MRPVVGYTIGVLDGAVALELEGACSAEQLAALEGETTQFILSPRAAIEIGKALMERGELALRPDEPGN